MHNIIRQIGLKKPAALCIVVVFLIVAIGPVRADAQAAVNTVQLVYWSSSETFSFGGALAGINATWNTPMYGIDYRLDFPSRWGFHLNGLTGTENNLTLAGIPFPGSFTDTVWSADLTYRWDFAVPSTGAKATGHVFAGYGGRNTGSLPATSNGVRVGVDGSFPFGAGWSLNANVAYEPSNNVSITPTPFPSITTTTTGWDYAVSLGYATPSGWTFGAGYRWMREDFGALSISGVAVCPCSQQWSGFFAQGGYTF
jgi:hypothetical protein